MTLRDASFWYAAIVRSVAFFVLWWVLTEGAGAAAFAVVVVPLALGASLVLARPHPRRVSLLGLLRFIRFFLWESLRGGVDVARRALHPRMPLAPEMVEYPLRARDERERVLLVTVMSLVPGTVGAALDENRIRLHVIDRRLPVERTIRRVEAGIAGIFGDAQ